MPKHQDTYRMNVLLDLDPLNDFLDIITKALDKTNDFSYTIAEKLETLYENDEIGTNFSHQQKYLSGNKECLNLNGKGKWIS